MAAPLNFELHMREFDSQLDDSDVDENVPNPLARFIESRKFDAAGAKAGIAAFASLAKTAYKPPSEDSNPWLITHPVVISKQIESEFDEPIEIADPHALAKRLGQDSGRAALRAWIQKCVDAGDSVEALAEYAAEHDAEKAALIREIGATL